MTVAEISVAGLASILVPFPSAADDHQSQNAVFLEQAGAAIVVQQSELNAEKLLTLIKSFVEDRGQLLVMAQAARSLAKPDACEVVATQCVEACYV